MLANGKYKTLAGSTVEISGKYSGISSVEFDWLEEGGCIECHVNAYPESDGAEWYIVWHCNYCNAGRALLMPMLSTE